MKNKNLKIKIKNQAFTLIEVLVSLFVVMIVTVGIYSLINFSLKITNDNKAYVEATSIANQKMEQIRNLPYSQIGTLNGSPHGDINDYETINRNGAYEVHTVIQYYDDPYDGTLDAGTDDVFTDYKIATIDVSWGVGENEKKVTVFSKIISATEETLSGYGLLKLSIVDSSGSPVPNANVHIENTNINPNVSVDYVSGMNGMVTVAMLPGFENYKISVSKTSYDTDITYSSSVSNPNPIKRHLSVYDNQKTEESFSIDLLTYLKIRTVSANLPNNFKINSDLTTDSQTNSKIVNSSDGSIISVWQDNRSTDPGIYVQKYSQAGNKLWNSQDINISGSSGEDPSVSYGFSNNIYISWCKDEASEYNCYLQSVGNVDGSNIWASAKKISPSINSNQINARIFASSTSTDFYVVWQDNRDGDYDIYMQKYNSSGVEQWAQDKLVNINIESGNSINQYDPELFVDIDENIYIAWTDDRNSNFDIYMQKFSKDGNALFLDDKKVNIYSGSANQYSPSISMDSNKNSYITWTDARSTSTNIYIQKMSTDGSALFLEDKKISEEFESTNKYFSTIVLDSSDNLYIAWTDERNKNKDIYSQKLDTSANRLWVKDLRVNVNIGDSPQYNPNISIDKISNKVFASWDDNRNGNLDVYFSEVLDYGELTNLSGIPINIRGSRKIGENPIVYKYDQNYTSDSNGEINLNIGWDSQYSISVVSASTTYSLIMSNPLETIELLPGGSRELIFYLSR